MTDWNQQSIHNHMTVFTSDGEQAGHVAETYEDSFLIHKGFFLPANRYIPYNQISRVEGKHVYLLLNAEQLSETLWQKRPDYERHLGDPTQLFYDEGHGIPNPFAENEGGPPAV